MNKKLINEYNIVRSKKYSDKKLNKKKIQKVLIY